MTLRLTEAHATASFTVRAPSTHSSTVLPRFSMSTSTTRIQRGTPSFFTNSVNNLEGLTEYWPHASTTQKGDLDGAPRSKSTTDTARAAGLSIRSKDGIGNV